MEDLITKRLKAFEGDISKTICLEDMISKKVWFIDLHRVKLKAFFSRKYENIIIIGDLNIDTENKRKDNSNYLSDLFDIFSLKNLITDVTCVKSTNETSIDVLLINKSRCFHYTASFETGLIDCHKQIFTFFKTYFKKLPPKNIEYRNYKTLTKIIFSTNLTKNLAKGLSVRKNIISMVFLQIFLEWFLINMLQ